MTTSIVSTHNLIIINPRMNPNVLCSSSSSSSVVGRRRLMFVGKRMNVNVLIPKAKNRRHSKRKKSWWREFFLNDDGNWLGLRDDDMVEYEEEIESLSDDGEAVSSDAEKFEAWKRRVDAIVELREAQNDMRNEESRRWEDWLVDDDGGGNSNGSVGSWSDRFGNGGGDGNVNGNVDGNRREETQLDVSKKGFVEVVSDRILGRQDEDMLYEDRVFQYASVNSAKFLAVLIIIPWAMDFVVHDYVLMPFLDRYVKTVPLAAQMLDVRRYQKLEMIKELKVEKARFRFEEEIGKSPPLSDDEIWVELRHKALELRDEWRLENRRAFANIWSDMAFGVTLFLLLFFNQNRVALLKFTGYKILNNISDTGKAFLIILITDIFLGYHSESGWQTLLEIVIEHYGFEVDSSAITIFVCLIPVVIDACVKLWLFKFLPRLSPRVANIFQEMKRH